MKWENPSEQRNSTSICQYDIIKLVPEDNASTLINEINEDEDARTNQRMRETLGGLSRHDTNATISFEEDIFEQKMSPDFDQDDSDSVDDVCSIEIKKHYFFGVLPLQLFFFSS